MLKTVSSITNALGALNYKGTWDANANSPALTSSVGTKGDYYVVGTAGSTNLNGISNWGVGDWAAFNGSVWQRVEGGADLNGVNLSVSGTSTLSGLTASTALALNASKEIVSVTNTGTGNNVLATAPTLVGNVTLSTGNLIVSDTKGIDFSLTPGTGTSELLNDYEEGIWTPVVVGTTSAGTATYAVQSGVYTKVGNRVAINLFLIWTGHTGTGDATITGLPYTSGSGASYAAISLRSYNYALTANNTMCGYIGSSSATIILEQTPVGGGATNGAPMDSAAYLMISAEYSV